MRPPQKCVDIPVGFEWLLVLLSLWAGAHTLLIWASAYSVSALLTAFFFFFFLNPWEPSVLIALL